MSLARMEIACLIQWGRVFGKHLNAKRQIFTKHVRILAFHRLLGVPRVEHFNEWHGLNGPALVLMPNIHLRA
jgi:hypothetical protein